MGFYLEMRKEESQPEFAEFEIPYVYWVLYGLTGFALTCMGLAAYSLLWDLARTGSWIDIGLIGLILAAVPGYLVIGAKMAFARRFVRFEGNTLEVGFRFLGRPVGTKKIPRQEIRSVELLNLRPSPNRAVGEHDDRQYHIRGHWRIVIEYTGGTLVADRHTEKEMLVPLYDAISAWRSAP